MVDALVLRLRCPADIASPDPLGGHVRIDLGMPIPPALLAQLVTAIGKCPCGRAMVFLAHDTSDPWRHA